jgi:hypothetical protein
MLQLRKQDVRREGKHWIVHVTPEAGPVKTDEARDVVLHRQIVESGFLDFVQTSNVGHLFIPPGVDELGVRKAVKTARNKVNMFVREVVPDPHVDPSHGWRHRLRQSASMNRLRCACWMRSKVTRPEKYFRGIWRDNH